MRRKEKTIKLKLTDEMFFYLKQKEGVFGSVQEYIRTLIYNDMNAVSQRRVEVQEAVYEQRERTPVPIVEQLSIGRENLHSELISELKTVFRKKKIGY